MQHMNQGETNGIVIGPEFSRIFAEIVLQGVDEKLEKKLVLSSDLHHRIDYEIFRYVDDYFIFYNEDADAEKISRHLAAYLKEVKLNLNTAKSEKLEKPIITKLTIAKNRVAKIFASYLLIEEELIDHPDSPDEKVKRYSLKTKANALIIEFKTVLVESDVKYADLLNYAFSAVERRTKKYFDMYEKNMLIHQNPRQLTRALIGILEFCFFAYAAAPRVNFSVKLTRIVSEIVDRLNRLEISRDEKSQVLKYAFDNLKREMGRSSQEEYREMETLYLVLALKKLGREYDITQETLMTYLGVFTNKDGTHDRKMPLDYFSITVALLYIGGKGRYRSLKKFIEADICKTFEKRAAYIHRDTELMMLYLDLLCCPHISEATKLKLFGYLSLSIFELPHLRSAAKYWFTDWGNFDLSVELDKKRTRDVY